MLRTIGRFLNREPVMVSYLGAVMCTYFVRKWLNNSLIGVAVFVIVGVLSSWLWLTLQQSARGGEADATPRPRWTRRERLATIAAVIAALVAVEFAI